MDTTHHQVERHYGRGRILESIMAALRETGHDTAKLIPADLALVDEFHTRGREATIELARRAALVPGLRVLDLGCGLGGSARYLASEYRCRVVGVDLTHEYVEVANALAELVGMKEAVTFRQASALDLPFGDCSFDVVWTEHVQMNIADKRGFYSEIARVLAPRGHLLFHDVLQGPGGALHYPVPWAEEASISFLVTPEALRKLFTKLGFSVVDWDDKSQASLKSFVARAAQLDVSGLPPLGFHLLMGQTTRLKLENNIRNLSEGRAVVVQGVVAKAQE